MENQNSSPQNKKKFFDTHGKKKKAIITVIAVSILFGVAGRAFAFRGAWGIKGYPFMGTGNVVIAAKDFKSLGIVFADTTANRRDGYRAAYNALMKEAAQKGGDAVINVNISRSGSFFNRTWSGSATAIKYLETAPSNTSLLEEIGNTALMLRNERGFGRNRF